MDEERMIGIAKQLASDLGGVRRNDWRKWTDLVDIYGWEKSTQMAEKFSRDMTLRENIQRTNGIISGAIKIHQVQFARISREERRTIFGYVSWMLKVAEKEV